MKNVTVGGAMSWSLNAARAEINSTRPRTAPCAANEKSAPPIALPADRSLFFSTESNIEVCCLDSTRRVPAHEARNAIADAYCSWGGVPLGTHIIVASSHLMGTSGLMPEPYGYPLSGSGAGSQSFWSARSHSP